MNVIQETYKLLPTIVWYVIHDLVCCQILYSILFVSLGYLSLFIWNLVTTCDSSSPLYRSLSVPGIVILDVILKNIVLHNIYTSYNTIGMNHLKTVAARQAAIYRINIWRGNYITAMPMYDLTKNVPEINTKCCKTQHTKHQYSIRLYI